MASLFLIAALFVYSYAFTAAFIMPKILVLSIGLLLIAICDKTIRTGPVFWAGLLFLAVSVIMTIYGVDIYLGIVGRHNNYSMGLLGLAIALLYHSAPSDISTFPIAGAILGLLAFSQYFGVILPLSEFTGNRAYVTAGSPINLGLILAMILPLSGSFVYSLAIILGLLATGSRGAFMAAGIGTLVARYSND